MRQLALPRRSTTPVEPAPPSRFRRPAWLDRKPAPEDPITYGVAFKVVTILGLLSLPVCAWAFGRLSGMRFPGPAVLAIATVPFLFDRGFTIYGGNIASTLAGEFSFSISPSLAFLFLGL